MYDFFFFCLPSLILLNFYEKNVFVNKASRRLESEFCENIEPPSFFEIFHHERVNGNALWTISMGKLLMKACMTILITRQSNTRL